MPTTREQRLESLQSANHHRLTAAQLRKKLRSGEVDLIMVLRSPYTGSMDALEVLGLAFIGQGVHGTRAARLALTVAAGMPFRLTHGTRLDELTPGQRVDVFQEFAAAAGSESDSPASASASR